MWKIYVKTGSSTWEAADRHVGETGHGLHLRGASLLPEQLFADAPGCYQLMPGRAG